MAIARINGQMLQQTLERAGYNLSITNLISNTPTAFFDVNNNRLGVNTGAPNYSLEVIGNAHIGNLYILNDTITSDTGKINLGAISNLIVTGGQVNNIVYTDGAGNLSFGTLDTLSGLEGFTGNYIALGVNSVGSLSDALTISTATTVTDGIARLNQLLGNITDSVGSTIHVTGNISGSYISGNIVSPTIDSINANITAANLAIATLQANVGAFETYANIDIAATNANLTAFGTYSNANASVQAVSIQNLATYANANTAAYLTTYTGNIGAGNITANLYGNIHTDIITPYQTTVTTFNSSTAIGLPIGGNVARPGTPLAGQFRYNSDLATVEFYNGSGWVALSNTITDQAINPDGTSTTYTLNNTTTAVGILVSINGTVQQPGVAYTVSGNQITFSEVPLITDIIDVRFLSAATTLSMDTVDIDSSNVAVTTSNTIIDSFSTTNYRSVKYIISSTTAIDAHMAEVLLVQNSGVVATKTTSNINTNVNTITYSANINGSTVNLLAQGTVSSSIRIQRTYFNV